MSTEQEDRTLTTEVFEALGAASVCWIGDGWKTDVFDSSRARAIGDELMGKIRAEYEPVLNHLYIAMTIICNVDGGNMDRQAHSWVEAAQNWIAEFGPLNAAHLDRSVEG